MVKESEIIHIFTEAFENGDLNVSQDGTVTDPEGNNVIRKHGRSKKLILLRDGVSYSLSLGRALWLYHHGELPSRFVYHLDGDSNNFSLDNLTLRKPTMAEIEGKKIREHQKQYARSAVRKPFDVDQCIRDLDELLGRINENIH